MKINEFFKDKKNIIAVVCVLLVAVLLVVHTIITNNILNSGGGDVQTTSNVNPRYRDIMENGAAALDQDTTAWLESTTSYSATIPTRPINARRSR